MNTNETLTTTLKPGEQSQVKIRGRWMSLGLLRDLTIWHEYKWQHVRVGDLIPINAPIPERLRGKDFNDILESHVVGERITMKARVAGDIRGGEALAYLQERGQEVGLHVLQVTTKQESRDLVESEFIATAAVGDPPDVPAKANIY